MKESQSSKIEKFIQQREELKKSPIPNKASNASIFKDANPRVKSLKPAGTIEPKDITKLTPERFKSVQNNLKAKSSIKSKLSQALKKGDKEAVKGIVSKVGEVAKKTGNTDFLADLVKRVSKSKFAKQGVKQIVGAIPLIGGVAAAISSGDIKAAVPGLDYVDDLGPQKGTLNHRMETGTLTPEDIELLRKQNER